MKHVFAINVFSEFSEHYIFQFGLFGEVGGERVSGPGEVWCVKCWNCAVLDYIRICVFLRFFIVFARSKVPLFF